MDRSSTRPAYLLLVTDIPGNRQAFYRFLLEHNKVYIVSLELKNQDCTN
ncbi:hypothetical protein [Nonomuraea sp. NEAU-A123]|nr:hypothetical protein [Nonomuraea sp. NEAU-A123]MBT2232167.1 hypothetical protein [Nonomuraea sp. NEAU-A123]